MKADYSDPLYAFKVWLKKWKKMFTAGQDTSAAWVTIFGVCIIIKTQDVCFQMLLIK